MIYKALEIISYRDFIIRCDEIYEVFWEDFVPNYDIAIYREYLLNSVMFSDKPERQETLAGRAWEYLMGDIDEEDLY